MKIVVLGVAGMLGHKMLQTLRRAFPEVVGTTHARAEAIPAKIDLLRGPGVVHGLDAADFDSVARLLREVRPDVVVNCIGVIKQRGDAKAAIPSITINALLPHKLDDVLSAWSGRLVHFSTDCVFSGKQGPYREDSPPDADDLYGRTKLLGEVTGPRALTLRTSIIGRELSHFASLLEWFLAQKGKRVSGFSRALYSGVTTNHLSSLVTGILRDHRDLAGLYQVASETISKYDLLHLLDEAFRVGATIDRNDTFHCDRSLDGARLAAAIGYRCPPWPQLVAELAADDTPYELWRSV
jgi:dTDP-4-dehydrorhamnose reductase